jgi:DNA-directed RNA polymerase specialized sigma24 family protein
MRKLRRPSLGPIIADALKQIDKALKESLKNDLWSQFPNIDDYSDEELERKALWKIIKRKRKLGPEELLKIFTLKKEGKSSREIAKELGCSHTAVNRGYDRTQTVFREEGLLE